MNDEILYNVKEFVHREWKNYNSNEEYRGVWFALHEPFDGEDDVPITPASSAWFITNSEIVEKKVSDYKIFMEYGISYERKFDIAYANTAMIKSRNLIYVSYQFGKLFGRAYTFEVKNGNKLTNKTPYWVS